MEEVLREVELFSLGFSRRQTGRKSEWVKENRG
jgi:hypothetical protein